MSFIELLHHCFIALLISSHLWGARVTAKTATTDLVSLRDRPMPTGQGRDGRFGERAVRTPWGAELAEAAERRGGYTGYHVVCQ